MYVCVVCVYFSFLLITKPAKTNAQFLYMLDMCGHSLSLTYILVFL